MEKNKTIYPAATIMLVRDYEGTFQVLLLQRNKALSFAPGQWVFPGGRVEAQEIDRGADDLGAAKLAAIRETKEEAGIEIEMDDLIFIRHWTTPEVSPKRFATWFFFAALKEDIGVIQIDDEEIKDYLWINPQVALEDFRSGKLPMLPPTFLNLQLIRKCQSVQEAKSVVNNLKPIHVLPRVKMTKDAYNIMYKGDAGYDSYDLEALGPRHRLTIRPSSRLVQFEHKDCGGYPPVNGGDDFFN